jgi:hypothetical protein
MFVTEVAANVPECPRKVTLPVVFTLRFVNVLLLIVNDAGLVAVFVI